MFMTKFYTNSFLKRYHMLRLNVSNWKNILRWGRGRWWHMFVVAVVVVVVVAAVVMTTDSNIGLEVCALLRGVCHYLLPRQCHGVGVTPVTIHVTISHHVTKRSGPRGYL